MIIEANIKVTFFLRSVFSPSLLIDFYRLFIFSQSYEAGLAGFLISALTFDHLQHKSSSKFYNAMAAPVNPFISFSHLP